MQLSLQEWVRRISKEDRSKLASAMAFSGTPENFNKVMAELRAKYDFIPKAPDPE